MWGSTREELEQLPLLEQTLASLEDSQLQPITFKVKWTLLCTIGCSIGLLCVCRCTMKGTGVWCSISRGCGREERWSHCSVGN